MKYNARYREPKGLEPLVGDTGHGHGSHPYKDVDGYYMWVCCGRSVYEVCKEHPGIYKVVNEADGSVVLLDHLLSRAWSYISRQNP